MRKYIITNTYELRQGDVAYHKDLLPNKEPTKELHALGGGLWMPYPKDKIIIYYGFSAQFGEVTKEQFLKSDKWRVPVIEHHKWEVIFDTFYDINEVLKRNGLKKLIQ